jgi:hypothetical protein
MTDTVTTTDRELTTDEIDRIAGGYLVEAIVKQALAGGQREQSGQDDHVFSQILQQMTQG